jgi:uncharacterized protein YbaR (Trm112 family)
MDKISAELLEILVCPETHQRLKLAPPELVEQLKTLQTEGKLKNRAGAVPAEPLHGALLREDGAFVYPISDGIPIMLIDEAIPLDQLQL